MTGTIPTEIGLLSKLIVLFIEDSYLQGSTLPSEIGNLTKLRTLNVRDEPRLSGRIPSELGSLVALARLDVSKTGLRGRIPEESVCAKLACGRFHC